MSMYVLIIHTNVIVDPLPTFYTMGCLKENVCITTAYCNNLALYSACIKLNIS